MGETLKPKFKYINPKHSKKGGLKNIYVRIKVTKCSNLVMWYRNEIGKEFDAEIQIGSFYVILGRKGDRIDGGLIELGDAEIISKLKT